MVLFPLFFERFQKFFAERTGAGKLVISASDGALRERAANAKIDCRATRIGKPSKPNDR
jgi:hypothetical protein